MIRIITPGKTDFRMTCDKCGCVFEYNVVDIDDGYIKCPTCGKKHYGFGSDYELEKDLAECDPTKLADPKHFLKDYTTPLQTTPDMPTYDLRMSSKNDCEGCPTYKQICSPTGYVGDLPCQWCSKNPWKVTCDTATYTTSAGNETRGARSWSSASATAFSEPEDMKITCKAEGVEYTTTLEGCSNTFATEGVQYTFSDYIPDSYTSCSEGMKEYYNICENANGGTAECGPCETCSCGPDCDKANDPNKNAKAESWPDYRP